MSEKWDLVPVSRIARKVSRPVSVDASSTYRLLGAHWYAKGLYVKDEKAGFDIRARNLYRVKPGDFVYNRLFAWKGSFAVAQEEHEGCHVSNEFPCFELDRRRVIPKFLWLYFSRETAWLEALGLSGGSTTTSRNRLKELRFLGMEIPLPPLVEQRRIVARIEELAALIEEAQALRAKAQEEAEALLESALQNVFAGQFGSPDVWPPLSAMVERIENGWSPACLPYPAHDDEWGVLKVGAVSTGEFVAGENKALPPHLEPRREFEIRHDDFLFGRANTRRLVGACTVVQNPPKRLLLCDKIFRFVLRPKVRVDRLYLSFALKSPPLREQIEAGATGTSSSMKNISKAKVMRLRVPLPTLAEQRRVVAYLDRVQAQLDELTALQDATQAELDALLPSVLDRAFRGELLVGGG